MQPPTSRYGCGNYDCLPCYGDKEWQATTEASNLSDEELEEELACSEDGMRKEILKAEQNNRDIDESVRSSLYEDAITNGEPWALEDDPELWNPQYKEDN